MLVYFGGSENPGHRKRLIEWNVKAMGINFKHLLPRLPKKSQFLLQERFPDDVRLMVHFDVPEEAPELVDAYREWVEVNAERLDFAIEPSGVNVDLTPWREDSPAIPIWRPEDGHRALQKLVSDYSGIAVPQSAWDSEKPVTARINRIVTGDSTHVHGLGVSKWEILSTVALGSISTGAWTSAQRYGETQVWDGNELRRFPADDKKARQRYRAHIARSGLDVDAIEADDKNEVCKLAVWSWQRVEESLSKRRNLPTDIEIGRLDREGDRHLADSSSDANAEPDGADPVTTDGKGATKSVRTRETKPLPVAVFGRNDGGDDAFEVSHATKRMCDNCHLDKICPEYDMGSSCAYDIPVRIRTKDQIMGMLNGLIEMQTQRVMFARFREDLEGSIDIVTSNELDRLMALTEKYKDITDDAETFKMQIEAKGQSGVLSRLFGAKVGDAARELQSGGMTSPETDLFMSSVMGTPIDVVAVSDTSEPL